MLEVLEGLEAEERRPADGPRKMCIQEDLAMMGLDDIRHRTEQYGDP